MFEKENELLAASNHRDLKNKSSSLTNGNSNLSEEPTFLSLQRPHIMYNVHSFEISLPQQLLEVPSKVPIPGIIHPTSIIYLIQNK